jgi:hypothetical protein
MTGYWSGKEKPVSMMNLRSDGASVGIYTKKFTMCADRNKPPNTSNKRAGRVDAEPCWKHAMLTARNLSRSARLVRT